MYLSLRQTRMGPLPWDDPYYLLLFKNLEINPSGDHVHKIAGQSVPRSPASPETSPFSNFLLFQPATRFIEWPADALLEVATKLLEEEKLGALEVKAGICQVFVTAHQSVQDMAAKMKEQLKRQVYVTPTNYLEFAKG
jgi:hypothetical protein